MEYTQNYEGTQIEGYGLPSAVMTLDLENGITDLYAGRCVSCKRTCKATGCKRKRLSDSIDEFDVEAMFSDIILN